MPVPINWYSKSINSILMSDHKTSLRDAKAWLQENPSETATTAARIFKIKPDALRRSIARDTTQSQKHGGHNRLLSETQLAVLKQWIQQQYENGTGATKQMVYSAVCYLRNPSPAPSQSWVTKFIKHQLTEFHTITTKPISRQRTTAHNESVVIDWFKRYKEFLQKHGLLQEHSIKPGNLWNMDETGFRVGIPGGEQVLVPVGVHELYTPSPENRSSVTIVEAVSASGQVIPPVLIIQGKTHMEAWYHENLHGPERMMLSDSGYINDQLAIEWLQHFILHTGSSKDSEPKVLLLDSHASHHYPPFAIFAAEHQIFPFALPSHLTHIMQPLDVGIFQPYKHWHKVAVQTAIRSLDLQYNISSFLRDLPKIRVDTFKVRTVVHAFENAGMWPVDSTVAIKKIKKYSKPEKLPQTPASIPATFRDSEEQLQMWKAKIPVLLSSPSRQRYQDFLTGTEQVLVGAQLQELDYSILQKQVTEQRNQKSKSRRTLQLGGALTAADAHRVIQLKAQKEADKQAKQVARAAKSAAVQARKELHQAGVQARRKERERKNTVAGLLRAKEVVPPELQEPIPDPEALAKLAQATEITSDSSNGETDESDEESVIFLL